MIDSLDDGYVSVTTTVVGIVVFSMVAVLLIGLSTRVETSSFQRSASDYRTELADQFLNGVSDSEDCLRTAGASCANFDLPAFGTWLYAPADTGWCNHEDRMVENAPPAPFMRTVTYCVVGQYGIMQINVTDCYYITADCTTPPAMVPAPITFATVPAGFCNPAAAAWYLRVVTIDDGETVFTTRTHRTDPCLVS